MELLYGLGKFFGLLRSPAIDHDGPLVLDDIAMVKAKNNRVDIHAHFKLRYKVEAPSICGAQD
jgi:hypothetical protein